MMKNKILSFFLLLVLTAGNASAAINKVFINVTGETPGNTPVNGSLTWTKYLGSSKLAFAKGYTYLVKIEFSAGTTGTLQSSSANAVVSGLTKSGSTYTFKLSVSSAAARLSAFDLGIPSLLPAAGNTIVCEVVEIGRFYSLLVTDSSQTTRVTTSLNPGLSTLVFKSATGVKYLKFSGAQLANARFIHSSASYTSGGISISPPALSGVSATSFTVPLQAITVSSTASLIKEAILSKIMDTAADKSYPWISYKYALMIPPSGQTPPPVNNTGGSGLTSSTQNFEVLPGQWQILNSFQSGYSIFLEGKYMVD